MAPDKKRAATPPRAAALASTSAASRRPKSVPIVAQTDDSAAWRCWSWRSVRCCGCGRPGDCILNTPAPEPVDQAEYDVIVLGLVPHARDTCPYCGEVGT